MYKLSPAMMTPKLECRLAAHARAWQESQLAHVKRKLETHPFVTISRQYGCQGLSLSHQLVDMLNVRFRPSIPWVAYDRELLEKVAEELHVRREILDGLDGRYRDAVTEFCDAILNLRMDESLVFRKLAELMRSLAVHGHAVLLGRGGYLLTQNLKNGFHIRLVAPREWRVERTAVLRQVNLEEAGHIVDQLQKERDRFIRTFFTQDPDRLFYHDLVIDNSRFNDAQLAELVFDALVVKFGSALCGE
jgi:cytidylate kinase